MRERLPRPDSSDFIRVPYVPIDIGMAMKSLTNRDIGARNDSLWWVYCADGIAVLEFSYYEEN